MSRPVALVTAAGQGIGAAIARRLATGGYRVVLLARSPGIAALAAELDGRAVVGSVTGPADLDRLVDDALDAYGRIDGVVVNTGHGGGSSAVVRAGTYPPEPGAHLLDLEDGAWHAGLDLYLMPAVRLARRVTPVMVAAGGGAWVNISASGTVDPRPEYPLSTLRLALHGFARLYADRYGPQGIRMNNLLPGLVENWPLDPDVAAGIPAGRAVTLAEVAETAAFLLSPGAGAITGQNILVDGGLARGVR